MDDSDSQSASSSSESEVEEIQNDADRVSYLSVQFAIFLASLERKLCVSSICGDYKLQAKIRSEISTMSFEELMKLKEKLGSKVYSETVFGQHKVSQRTHHHHTSIFPI